MSSLFFACLNFSYDWGGKFMTAIMFGVIGIDDDTTNVYQAVEYKIVILVVFFLLALYLPNREEMQAARRNLDSEVDSINRNLNSARHASPINMTS